MEAVKIYTVELLCEKCKAPMETEFMTFATQPLTYLYFCVKCRTTVKSQVKHKAIREQVESLSYLH